MKIKDLVSKLQTFDQELDVILEPYLDWKDVENYPYDPSDIVNGDIAPLTFRFTCAQKDYEEGDEEYNCEYFYDTLDNPFESKKVLVISSPALTHGTIEKESL